MLVAIGSGGREDHLKECSIARGHREGTRCRKPFEGLGEIQANSLRGGRGGALTPIFALLFLTLLSFVFLGLVC